MAKLVGQSTAQAISQIDTVTMTGTWADTETVTIKVSAKSVTYTCGAAETVTTVASGLLALCQASTALEFGEITWTSAAGVITATSTAGVPVTITTSDTAAAGTSTLANTQAATGPNHWDNAENWSTGSVPTTADEVFIESPNTIFLYGLPTSLSLNKLVVSRGQVGLPDWNTSGYQEYRTVRAVITCTDVSIGKSAGKGPALCRLDLASGAADVAVFGSANRSDQSTVDLLLNNSGATVAVISGQVAISESGAATSTVGTVRVASGGSMLLGEGLTVTSILSAGSLTSFAAVTNLTVDSGTSHLLGDATVTTLIIRGGSLNHKSDGTITAATVGPGQLDCSTDIRTRTITDLTLNKAGVFRDPYSAVTVTNGIVLGTDADSMSAS